MCRSTVVARGGLEIDVGGVGCSASPTCIVEGVERRWRFGEEDDAHAPPIDWWGRVRVDPGSSLSLVDLVRLGSLDAATAAFLWMAMEQRATLLVAAREHGAGKTTLLNALVELLPAEVKRYYLRGWYERFAFVTTHDPNTTYLLVNEISDHLPIYLWGKGVRRVFALLAEGWRLGATVHAEGAEEVFSLLQGFPLEVPSEYLHMIDVVVTLGMGITQEGLLRRVLCVEAVRVRGTERTTQVLARRETLRSPLTVNPAACLAVLTERFGLPLEEASRRLAWRQQQLARWVAQGVGGLAAFRQALAELRALELTEAVDAVYEESRIEETPEANWE